MFSMDFSSSNDVLQLTVSSGAVIRWHEWLSGDVLPDAPEELVDSQNLLMGCFKAAVAQASFKRTMAHSGR